jgi:hypothetical protein
MGSIHIDDSGFPIVRVTFTGSVSNEEFDEYLAGMSRMIGRRQPNVTILDARHSARTPAVQRKKQADWIKQHEAELRRYSCGTAFVITSALIRGVLTAILWLQPMPQAHTVVGSLDEAERWARAQLDRRGAGAPSSSTA